jgi:hypothetical protein
VAEGDLVSFTAEELVRINAAIQEKAGGYKPCHVCGTTTWIVYPGLVPLTIQLKGPIVGTEETIVGTSCVMLVCQKCGNTILLNVFILGLGDLFGVKSRGQEQAEQKAAVQKAQALGAEAKAGAG